MNNETNRNELNEANNAEMLNNGPAGEIAKLSPSPCLQVSSSAAASFLALPDVEPWPEPVDGKVLLDELVWVLGSFVVLPKWGKEALALWTLHTYAFELREVTAYVGIESPDKRCGKTTLLTVLSELVNRPVIAANISSPAFFRVIEEARPTLLIDEADTFLQGNDELRGILNSGYSRKTAYVVRVASQESEARSQGADGKGSRLARFSCWCPKAMAAIGSLPDTLADRCIVIGMQRKTSKEECGRLRNLETTALRRRCARFVIDHESAIARALPEIPPSLNDRAADIWEPLLALAELAGGGWPDLGRRAAVGLTTRGQENSPIGSLLFDILFVFVTMKMDRIFSQALVEGLNSHSDRPWIDLRNGKPLTELSLAQHLRPYGIRPRTMRIDDLRAKGYYKEDFKEVFPRYIPRSELDALLAVSEKAKSQGNSNPAED